MNTLKNQLLEILTEDFRTPLETMAVMTGTTLEDVASAIEEMEQ